MMKDFELFQLIKPVVDAALVANSIPAVLTQSYQPTRQGVQGNTQVFMQKLFDKRYGWVERYDVWNALNDDYDHVESQQVESTFQVGAMTLMTPSNTSQLTSSDILFIVAATLQNLQTIESFQEQGVGILRVTDLRNPFFSNDLDQFESSPSFDFTVTHKRVTILSTPKASPVSIAIYPV